MQTMRCFIRFIKINDIVPNMTSGFIILAVRSYQWPSSVQMSITIYWAWRPIFNGCGMAYGDLLSIQYFACNRSRWEMIEPIKLCIRRNLHAITTTTFAHTQIEIYCDPQSGWAFFV